jgi:phage terminase small subunit
MTELKFKSPKTGPENAAFIEYWEELLPDIQDRDNLKPSHLQQLRVLCDLYVEYDQLQAIISIEGRTYWSTGRNGDQLKPRPEVQLMARTISEIRNYSKLLGLCLYKDTKTNEPEEDEDEF